MRRLLDGLLALVATVQVGASSPVTQPGRAVVAVRPPAVIRLAPGGSVEARLRVIVMPGYHVQANPASQRFLIPAQLELEPRSGIRAGNPRYPPAQPYRLQGADNDLAVYSDSFEVVVPLHASRSAAPGRRTLAGALRYQACDARLCLPPSSLALELIVEVDPKRTR